MVLWCASTTHTWHDAALVATGAETPAADGLLPPNEPRRAAFAAGCSPSTADRTEAAEAAAAGATPSRPRPGDGAPPRSPPPRSPPPPSSKASVLAAARVRFEPTGESSMPGPLGG